MLQQKRQTVHPQIGLVEGSDEHCSLIVLFNDPGMPDIFKKEVMEGFQQSYIMRRAADILESSPKRGQPRVVVNSGGRCTQFHTYMSITSEQCMF